MPNLKQDIQYLGLDYKKEITKLILYNVILLVLVLSSFFFIKQVFINVFIVLGGITFDYVLITSYSSKRKSVLLERKNDLIKLISYFRIFINNNTSVYHAIESLIPYSSEWMANEISNLLKNIDIDKSVIPFVNFASIFKDKNIENVMTSIYQMIEMENNDRLSRFALIFQEIERNHKKELLSQKSQSLDLINNFPLFGAGLISIILTIGVMNIIGGMINGL